MIKHKQQKKSRLLKNFSNFFTYSTTVYDNCLLKLEKFALEGKFSKEMRKIISRCISMTKSLYDLNMIHNDSGSNLFIKKLFLTFFS